MGWYDTITCRLRLPGVEEGWAEDVVFQTKALDPEDASYEITARGVLVRLRKGHWHGYEEDGAPVRGEDPVDFYPAATDISPDPEFLLAHQDGNVVWIERTDHADFEGRARIYYAAGGVPVALPNDEYRRRVKLNDYWYEDTEVSGVRNAAGGGKEISASVGPEHAPEIKVHLPLGTHARTGQPLRLYFETPPGTAVRGVDLDGREVFYAAPEEAERRSRATARTENAAPPPGQPAPRVVSYDEFWASVPAEALHPFDELQRGSGFRRPRGRRHGTGR